jgi:glyoxylase-like metal-dependent hydrolase (beta-lactamase superfamily II)
MVSRRPFIARTRIGLADLTFIATRFSAPGWRPAGVSANTVEREVPHMLPGGDIPIDSLSLHIAVGGLSIIVDPSTYEQPSIAMGETRLSPGLIGGLRECGIATDRVTHVITTHAHRHHYSGIVDGSDEYSFPSALHLISRLDWETQTRDPYVDLPHLHTIFAPVQDDGRLRLVSEDGFRVGDGVSLIATPGETPGSMSLVLESSESNFMWVGDVFHHPAEFRHLDWMSETCEPTSLIASRQRVLSWARDRNAALAFAHGRLPGWGYVYEDDVGSCTFSFADAQPAVEAAG